MTQSLLEQDMYPPIQQFLMKQGFTVYSEVKGCDIVAKQSQRTVIVEMKTRFQLKLLYQAIDRQGICDEVYVAIPRPKAANTRQWKSMIKLLKRLDIGLLTVAMDSPITTVEVALTPGKSPANKNSKKRKALATEISGRTIDQNRGGMCRQKIVTAYREKAIELCCVLETLGESSLAHLRGLGFDEKQLRMLGSNVYGWYCRRKKGIYALSPEGQDMLARNDYDILVTYYRQKWRTALREDQL